jgi:hypothetical protein
MRLPFSARRPVVPAPLDHIADELEAVPSARISSRTVYADTEGSTSFQQGVWDLRHHRGLVGLMDDQDLVGILHTGPDFYSRLSPEERERTGLVWKWEGERDPRWAGEHAETIASIRHLAHQTDASIEGIRGEWVYHYSLRIRSRPDVEDPLLTAVHEAFESGLNRLTVEVWIGEDGRLRQFRDHAVMSKSYRRRTGTAEAIRDFWDFGVELPDLSVPAPGQVLWPPSSETPSPGLTVLIDGEESSY